MLEAKQKRARPRLLRLGIISLATLILVAVIGGGLAWHFAAEAAAQALDAEIQDEQAHGRQWLCPERQISGFPFAIEISCKEPRFAGPISGKAMTAEAKSLRAAADLRNWREVKVEIEAPFVLRSDDRQTDLSIAWSALHFVLADAPLDISHVAFNSEALVAQGALEGAGSIDVKTEHFDGIISKAANGKVGAIDFQVSARQLVNPLLAMIAGSSEAVDFRAQGTLTAADIDPSPPPAVSLELWRRKGGQIQLGDLAFTQGATQFSARGTLSLDASHRLQGRFDTEARGIEPILRRFGINPSLATAGLLLSSLLGGSSAPPSGDPAALHLPVRLEDGHVIIGPVQTAIRLQPLY